MKRTYLEEDLQLIRKYFPGARAVSVRTPFDLTARGRRQAAFPHQAFRDDEPGGHPHGGLLWNR
jgi:hypothetical protein